MGQWVVAEGTAVTLLQPLDNAIFLIDMGARQPREFEPTLIIADDFLIFRYSVARNWMGTSSGASGRDLRWVGFGESAKP